MTEIVGGKRSITPDTAILLAEAFGTSVELWLNLQGEHDLRLARAKAAERPDRIERARALRRDLAAA